MSFKEQAKLLKTDVPVGFIGLRKKETPLLSKIFAGITVTYALSPIDLILDFIPVLGYLDDVILLPFIIALTIKSIPDEVFAECRKESESLWVGGKSKKWYYAIPIAVFWLIIIFVIVKAS